MWILLVGVVGVLVGIQSRREFISTKNIASLAPVAHLAKNDIWRIAWSANRERMAVVGWEKPVEVRDSVSLKLLESIGDGKKIIHFAFSPKDDVVAYSENNQSNTVVVLDRRSGRSAILNAGNSQPDVVFNPYGTRLVTGGYGRAVKLWSIPDGRFVSQFDTELTLGGLTPEFSPDGRLLAIGNRNDKTSVFDVASGKLLFRLYKPSSHELQFSPDGKALAVVYVDGSVAIWSVADGSLVAERKTNAEELYTVDWSPDGSLLATAGLKGKITIWNPKDLSALREITAPEWVIRVKFSPDGLNLNYAGGAQAPGGTRHLEVLGIEGALYSLLNRPRR
jgi:WD40 repeat protein